MKKNTIFLMILMSVFRAMSFDLSGKKEEDYASLTLDYLKKKMQKEEKIPGKKPPVFLFFSDFDGTIIDGDITEGRTLETSPFLKEDKKAWPGLMQMALEEKLTNPIYDKEGIAKFWQRYTELQKSDYRQSLIYLADHLGKLNPIQEKDLAFLIQKTFREHLSNYYFEVSYKIICGLTKIGAKVVVISASPHVFVRGASETLALPDANFSGVESFSKDSVVNFAEGKKERVKQFIKKWQDEGRRVVLLGGMGNSRRSDGPFLNYLAENGGLSFLFNVGDSLHGQIIHPAVKIVTIKRHKS